MFALLDAMATELDLAEWFEATASITDTSELSEVVLERLAPDLDVEERLERLCRNGGTTALQIKW